MHPEIDAVLRGESRWCVVHGDCHKVELPDDMADAVITDPPYGIAANRMTLGAGRKDFARGGDWDVARPNIGWIFCLAPKIAVWGGNYFTDQLPPTNDWLVWHKVNDGRTFSEVEMAWTNFGCQARHLSHHWSGEIKNHPTQKPREVMAWCISKAELPVNSVIVDPYCGSGTTGVAAVDAGYRFIGVEWERAYCDIARRRIADAAAQGNLFLGGD